MIQLAIQELTDEAFARFGTLIALPARAPDATGAGWQWWGEIALLAGDDRPFGIGYLDLQPAELRFDWAERHMRSAEMLIPTGGDCLVYVGPSDDVEHPERLPALDRFQAFRLRQGQAVRLHPGVWHGAPLALDRPLNVVVLLLQGSGAADTSVVRFAETPVEVTR
jgi:ureidoglycolate lyase